MIESTNPYSRPSADLETSATGDLATRGERLAAVLVDGVLMMAIVFPVLYAIGFWGAMLDAAARGGGPGLAWQFGALGIGFVAFVAIQGFPLHRTGQTWGKRVLGIRIVDMQGRQPSLVHLLLRRYLPMQVLSGLPVLGTVAGLVDSLLIFRNDRRCGHDLIGGTQVVKAHSTGRPAGMPSK